MSPVGQSNEVSMGVRMTTCHVQSNAIANRASPLCDLVHGDRVRRNGFIGTRDPVVCLAQPSSVVVVNR